MPVGPAFAQPELVLPSMSSVMLPNSISGTTELGGQTVPESHLISEPRKPGTKITGNC